MKRVWKLTLLVLLVAVQVLAVCWIVDIAFRAYEREKLLAYAPKDAGVYLPSTLLYNDHAPRITRDKAEGEYRILVFGDSYTYSITEPGLSYCAVLERRLGEMLGRKVRVVNLGYPGVSFPEYVNNLFFWTQALQFDAIVSNVFIGNDFEDVLHVPFDRTAIEEGFDSLCRRGLPYGPNTLVPILYQFRFLDYIKAKLLNELLRNPTLGRLFNLSDPTGEFPNPPGYTSMLNLGKERLATKHRINMKPYNRAMLFAHPNALPWYQFHLAVLSRLAAKGVPVLVMLSPPPCVMSPTTSAETRAAMGLGPNDIDLALPRRLTLELARRVGLPLDAVLDLTPCLAENTPSGQPTYVEDTHWSIAGNAWVGEILARDLARRWFGQAGPAGCPQPAPAFEPIAAGQLGPANDPRPLVERFMAGCPVTAHGGK